VSGFTLLNRALRAILIVDFEPHNTWFVQQSDDGKLIWIGNDQVFTHEPVGYFQRLEGWFLGRLPIDAEM